MMSKNYLVTAHCNNPDCEADEFQLMRRKMTYISSDDHEHVVSRIVCPECRQLGHVDKIASVEPGKKVA